MPRIVTAYIARTAHKTARHSKRIRFMSPTGSRTVEMTVSNRPGGDAAGNPDVTAALPPLTVDQMVQILLEPGLMI